MFLLQHMELGIIIVIQRCFHNLHLAIIAQSIVNHIDAHLSVEIKCKDIL